MRLTAFALLFISAITHAQDRMTPELMWKLGRVHGEIVTDDGKNVIYSITRYDVNTDKGFSTMHVIPAGGGKSTLIAEKGLGGRVLYVNNRGLVTFLHKGQLWTMNSDGSQRKQITNYEHPLTNARIAPDGKKILFSKEVELLEIHSKDRHPELRKSDAYVFDNLNYRHWDTWEDGKFEHIFYATYSNGKIGKAIDLMPGELFDAPQKPFGGSEDAIWSPDSKSIIYVSKKKFGKDYAISTNTDLYKYDLSTGQTINLTEGMKGYDTTPQFDQSGQKLAWLSMAQDGYEADKNRLYVYDFKTKQKYDLTADWDETVTSFSWSRDGSQIFFIAPVKGTQQLFAANSLKNLRNYRTKNLCQITHGQFDINAIIGQSGSSLIVSRTDMNHAAELFNVNLLTGRAAQITSVNKSIFDSIKLSRVAERTIKTSDNKKMLAWVIYPPDFDSTKTYPTLLYCQGGPQSPLTQSYSFRWNFQLMAANGYIVIAPNRRGMPGHGTEWNRSISGDWGGQPIRDYLAAIDDLSREPYVDKDRLGAVGASYGGYSVFMLAGVHNSRFKTFIAHDGLFDLKSWYGTTEELWFANYDIGGPYWGKSVPKSYEMSDPSKKVDNWNTPIMIVQGGKDYRVGIEQGLEAFQVAQLKGIKSRLLYLPEENHWVNGAQNAIVWQREFFKWLKETL